MQISHDFDRVDTDQARVRDRFECDQASRVDSDKRCLCRIRKHESDFAAFKIRRLERDCRDLGEIDDGRGLVPNSLHNCLTLELVDTYRLQLYG